MKYWIRITSLKKYPYLLFAWTAVTSGSALVKIPMFLYSGRRRGKFLHINVTIIICRGYWNIFITKILPIQLPFYSGRRSQMEQQPFHWNSEGMNYSLKGWKPSGSMAQKKIVTR